MEREAGLLRDIEGDCVMDEPINRHRVLRQVGAQAFLVRRWLAGETLREIGDRWQTSANTVKRSIERFIDAHISYQERARCPHSKALARAAFYRWCGYEIPAQ